MKRIARERGMTFYRARKMVKRIEAVVRIVEHRERGSEIRSTKSEIRNKFK